MRLAIRGDQERSDSGPTPSSWNRELRLLAVVALMVLATPAGASSAHDQLCYTCHLQAPGETGTKTTPPLWQSEANTEALMPARDDSASISTAACLSCHDGSVASAVNHASVSLGRTHPVGVHYDTFRDPDLHDTASPSGLGRSIEADMLVDGRVQCVSCHDLHGNQTDLLIKSNERSALCLTCHNK